MDKYKSELQSGFDHGLHPHYEVRVRGKMYLWGSAGLIADISFDKPLILHLRNALFGEPIDLATVTVIGPPVTIGTLQPGECVSIPLQKISGVFAICALETVVDCLIK